MARRCAGTPRKLRSALLELAHGLRYLALPTVGRLVAHPPLLEAPKPHALYGRVVHDGVFIALVWGYEPATLLLV